MRAKLIGLLKILGGILSSLLIATTSTSAAQVPLTDAHRELLEARTQQRTEALNRQSERIAQEGLQQRVAERQRGMAQAMSETYQAEKALKKAAQKKAAPQSEKQSRARPAQPAKTRKKKKSTSEKKVEHNPGQGFKPVARGAIIAT